MFIWPWVWSLQQKYQHKIQSKVWTLNQNLKTTFWYLNIWHKNFLSFILRACSCWDTYRTGKCHDRLSNYMGEKAIKAKAKDSSYRYFLRTSKKGESLGDTSQSKGDIGDINDFVYEHDKTCEENSDKIRKYSVVI